MDPTRTTAPWTPAAAPVFVPPPRYGAVRLLGRGGMGEVWEVHDTALDRRVALKVCLRDASVAAERFAREARITARLQHPGVLALYDVGWLDDGRPWYTMRLVPEGRALRRVWATPGDVRSRIRPLLAVANVLAFAHQLGIRHLDVKPDNVLLGAFGEVLLLDWGVAQDGDPLPGAAGTAGYAAPEQASRPTAASDVYALGVMLHEAVVGDPFVARARDDEAPLRHVWDACVGPELERPSAQDVAAALEDWLDDAQRRLRAEAHLARADAIAPRGEQLRREAKALGEGAAKHLAALPRLAPPEAKADAWDAEERAARLVDEAAVAEAEWEGAVTAALAEADLPEARTRLADRFLSRLVEAPAAPEARRWEQGVRTYGDARHLRQLDAPGAVTLVTEPPCTVRAYRYVLRRRRLEPVFVWERPGPLDTVETEPGSWLFELSAPGFALVRYPVAVARGEHWDGVPPDGTAPLPIRLPGVEELGPDDVYVPAGWTRVGGDALAIDPLPAGRRWVDAFVIRRFPVTAGEYLAWLDGLDEDAVMRFQPQDRPSPSEPWRALWGRGADGKLRMGRDALGMPWEPDMPITFVDVPSVQAYIDDVGGGWRLPRGVEVEKAARGVDGRQWPWGDGFDPAWACTAESHAGPSALRAVTEFPGDESPYGVRGLAGNARTWCGEAWTREGNGGDGPFREARGGAFVVAPAFCRPAGRWAAPPERRVSTLGFRLCRSGLFGVGLAQRAWTP